MNEAIKQVLMSMKYCRNILPVIVAIHLKCRFYTFSSPWKGSTSTCRNISMTTWIAHTIVIKLTMTYHVTGSVVSTSTRRCWARYTRVTTSSVNTCYCESTTYDVVTWSCSVSHDTPSLSHLRLQHLQAFVPMQIGAFALPTATRFTVVNYVYWTQWCRGYGLQRNALVSVEALQSTVRKTLGLFCCQLNESLILQFILCLNAR